jgi:transcriptional regulator with XRE-family HTH domain
MMDNEEIGLRLKELRKEWGYTQKQVANYLGFQQGQIAKLENGERTLKVSSLHLLCELYGCSQEYIVEGKGSYSKPNYLLKSNSRDIDLKTNASMNRIINNMKEMKNIQRGNMP